MSRIKQTNNKNIKKKKKKSIGFKILMGFLAILIASMAIGGGYLYGLFFKLDNVKLDNKDLGISSTDEFSKYDNYTDIKNIALFGVDAEDGGAGRSDSMMIVTIDPIHSKLKVTSLMRDSYVNIAGHGMDKLNHAYAFGGPQLAIKTINENFGLNVEDFATVNFSSLPIVIDLIGGVDIEIMAEELDSLNASIATHNTANGTNSPNIYATGPQHLDGTQALAYSRIRYTDGGDYKRTERQRTVLESLFTKLIKTSPSSYNSILTNVLPHVQTSLSPTTILSLGTKVLGIGNGTLIQERFPRDGASEGTTIDEIYYLTFDIKDTINQMRDYIFSDK
ncbi:LCP family protein [Clostridium gasigenes]|uniref:Cell envelope-related function transcriptional attenuator common domain-containing protein n=1 Tax=Clostridium gasigenes TaxID=94869 RepID=A0A1H0TG78_9CLOT|nr:LCP family protein [Clostridium gasigenes]MBU3088482.1 LCP family protein [Clostridium gasigenes]SDP52999.1 cell envelope-related function transcriptional attenuator common domain-containing protein [Clostridium gasigenes]